MCNLNHVLKETTLSRSTIYRLLDEEQFPARVRISKRRIGWEPAEILAWIAAGGVAQYLK
jgi:prophage regulatory protein